MCTIVIHGKFIATYHVSLVLYIVVGVCVNVNVYLRTYVHIMCISL